MPVQEATPLDLSNRVCIDISANLLSTYFAEKRSVKRRSLRATLTMFGFVAGSLLLVGSLSLAWHEAQESLEAAQSALAVEMQKARAIEAGFPNMQVPEGVILLPAQFRESNDKVVRQIGHVLASTSPDLSLQSLRYAQEGSAPPKLVGQAEATDIQAVRRLLDRVQTVVPELQGMITSVAQPQGGQLGVFSITFELSPRPAAPRSESEVKS